MPGLAGDLLGDVGEHALGFFRRRVLRAAEPAGRRDRANIGEHRLEGARAPQLVHLVPERVIGRVVDAIEVNEIGPMREHCQRLDLPTVSETVTGRAVKLLRHVAGLHGDHAHCVFAMKRLSRNG